MNFKQFEAFYWLTRLKSYQRVAEHINLTQPAVSVRVVGLEEELGVKLIESHAPNFKLTEKGLQAAEFAEAFMNLYERMQTGLKEKSSDVLTVGLAEPVIMTWGPELIKKAASDKNPIQTKLMVGSNFELRRLASEGVLDVAFTSSSLGPQTLADSFRIKYRCAWLTHKDLVPDTKRPLRPDDLARLNLIFFSRQTMQAVPTIESVVQARSATAVENTITSFTGACEMIRRGLGAAPLAMAPLAKELEEGTIVELNVTDPLPALEIRCVYLNRSRRKLTRHFYELAGQVASDWCTRNSDLAEFVKI